MNLIDKIHSVSPQQTNQEGRCYDKMKGGEEDLRTTDRADRKTYLAKIVDLGGGKEMRILGFVIHGIRRSGSISFI
jgi:hypothetical protein